MTAFVDQPPPREVGSTAPALVRLERWMRRALPDDERFFWTDFCGYFCMIAQGRIEEDHLDISTSLRETA